jgi:hypothetical protein
MRVAMGEVSSARRDRASRGIFAQRSPPCVAHGIGGAVMMSSAKRLRWFGGRILPTLVLGISGVLFARSSHADAASWLSLSGGMGVFSEAGGRRYPGALQLELGLGSSPARAVVVGGVVKSLSYFGNGTDLALTLRGASGGFARGGFGCAIDAGAYQRWWGVESTGFLGALVLGGPYGVQLTVMTEQGSNDVHAYTATLGIDLLRLTVYRGVSGGYWPNPILAPVEARR